MDILFHVGTAAGGRLLYPLLLAAGRAGCRVGAFFTHEGVLGLRDTDLRRSLPLVVGSALVVTPLVAYTHPVLAPVAGLLAGGLAVLASRRWFPRVA